MSRPISIEEMVRLFKSRHTTSHLFKIDNISLFKEYEIERAESSVFDLGGHKLKLRVYPYGNKRHPGEVCIFLERQNSDDCFEFELFVVSQLEPIWLRRGTLEFNTSSTHQSKGIKTRKSANDLEEEGYLIEDCCLFGVRLLEIKPANSGTAESFSLIEKPLNHKVTWMMSKFSSFNPEKEHYSNEFVVGNRKWKIQVHPRGFKEEKDDSFSVYLLGGEFINNVPNTNIFAQYKLRVIDQVNRNHIEKTYSGWHSTKLDELHGFSDFMPLEKLGKPYLVNDKLYVGVEFEVISVANYC